MGVGVMVQQNVYDDDDYDDDDDDGDGWCSPGAFHWVKFMWCFSYVEAPSRYTNV